MEYNYICLITNIICLIHINFKSNSGICFQFRYIIIDYKQNKVLNSEWYNVLSNNYCIGNIKSGFMEP